MADNITVKVLIDKNADSLLYQYLSQKSVRRRATFLRELATERLTGEHSLNSRVPDQSDQIGKKEKRPENTQQTLLPPHPEPSEKNKEASDMDALKKKKSDQLESKLGLFD